MNVKNKIRLERAKVKSRKLWNEIKDIMLMLILLNMLINNLQKITIFEDKQPVVITREVVKVVEAKTEPQVEQPKEEVLTAEFSAYTAQAAETDSNPSIMASGKKVYTGAIACPRHIDLGTKVEVTGLGTYTCEDRMNIRYTNNFDIYMDDYNEAIKFGRKQLTYKIIN